MARRSRRTSKSSKSMSKRSKRSKKGSKRRSKKRVVYSKLSKRCKGLLNKKISKNMREYKNGRYSSRSQALAVSFNQFLKSNPRCIK